MYLGMSHSSTESNEGVPVLEKTLIWVQMGTPLNSFHDIENWCLYLFTETKDKIPEDKEEWFDLLKEFTDLTENKLLKMLK